jgi:hypothetical protein
LTSTAITKPIPRVIVYMLVFVMTARVATTCAGIATLGAALEYSQLGDERIDTPAPVISEIGHSNWTAITPGLGNWQK